MAGDQVADVEVELSRPTDGVTDDASLTAAVKTSISKLAGELRLPLAPTPAVSIRDGPLQAAVNGRRMPLGPARGDFGLQLSPEGLVEAIHENPELLVTAGLASTLWAGWGGQPSDEPDGFADLLAELARHWACPERVRDAVVHGDERDAGRLFEDAMCEACAGVRVVVDERTHAAVRAAWDAETEPEGENVVAEIFLDLGIILGEPRLEADEALPEHHFAVTINDVRAPAAPCVPSGRIVVDDTPERLRLLNITDSDPAVNPKTGAEAALVSGEHAEMLEAAGLPTWDATGYLRAAVGAAARRHAAKLYTRDDLEFQVGTLEAAFPVLRAQIAAIGGPDRVTRVFRHLLAEQVSVREVIHVIESIHGAPALTGVSPDTVKFATRPYLPPLSVPEGLDAVEIQMAEAARMGLAPVIGFKQARGTGTLVVYLLEPKIEERLEDPAPLSDQEHDTLVTAIASEVKSLPRSVTLPAILTRMEGRWRLAHEMRGEFRALAVLAHGQISADLNIQPIARISLT